MLSECREQYELRSESASHGDCQCHWHRDCQTALHSEATGTCHILHHSSSAFLVVRRCETACRDSPGSAALHRPDRSLTSPNSTASGLFRVIRPDGSQSPAFNYLTGVINGCVYAWWIKLAEHFCVYAWWSGLLSSTTQYDRSIPIPTPPPPGAPCTYQPNTDVQVSDPAPC